MLRTRRQVRDISTSSCFSLKLPRDIACRTCQKYIETGSDRRKKDTCLKPWLEKWGTHRECRYVQQYEAVRDYLGIFKDGDIIEEKAAYPLKSTKRKVCESDAKESLKTSENAQFVCLTDDNKNVQVTVKGKFHNGVFQVGHQYPTKNAQSAENKVQANKITANVSVTSDESSFFAASSSSSVTGVF